MKPCIYGDQTYPEGATICVNGRELLCVVGEWVETGHACADPAAEPDAPERLREAPGSPRAPDAG
ncbi:MAG: DUF1496 domain-containing protein [Hydrogenophaga sp.]|uniref:DUF1496 domain-containing protein n=1 Tax=Hydrogenophaga sp. TaxID=1904254 RepID=UPI003D109D2C